MFFDCLIMLKAPTNRGKSKLKKIVIEVLFCGIIYLNVGTRRGKLFHRLIADYRDPVFRGFNLAIFFLLKLSFCSYYTSYKSPLPWSLAGVLFTSLASSFLRCHSLSLSLSPSLSLASLSFSLRLG